MSYLLLAVGLLTVAALILKVRHDKVVRARRLIDLAESAREPLARLRTWRATVTDGITSARADGRWIPRDVRSEWLRGKPADSPLLRELAKLPEAGAEARTLLDFVESRFDSCIAEANRQILGTELVVRRAFFDAIEKQPLTGEQAEAVVTFDNRVQVVAAAGSGKTSVMVARAAYAILRGFVPPEKILLLAFNKAAANELQERVDARLAAAGMVSTGLGAATFHSFGLDVIGRATGRKQRLAPWLDQGQDVAMVSRIVDELRDQSETFRFKWDVYRLLFARMGPEPAGGDPDGYDFTTKATGFRTFNGEVVKSQGERMIADFLYLNGVKYEYERPYSYDVATSDHSQYRPDFYYPEIDTWHEHWALDRDGRPPADFQGYAQSMEWKRSLHRRFGTSLIETTWARIIDNSGFQALADDLVSAGLVLEWNPDRPTPGAAPVKHEDLARLMRSCMAHVKSNSLTANDLNRRLRAAPTGVQRYRASVFLDLYWEIHEEWQRRLVADDSIDFEDMLVRAAQHIERGDVDMGFDLVLVDEFQDASQARARLARALVQKPHRYLLAVGDDWQSINRFAGADLSAMTDFKRWFGTGPTLRLQTTFRSPQAICDSASSFVSQNPRQLRKSVRSVHDEYGPAISLVRVSRQSEVKDALATVLEQLAGDVRRGLAGPGPTGEITVDVLGRYNFDRNLMPTRHPEELKVRFRTVHSSKGLEADYIVIPNVTAGTYGFPSEIVDDPVLSLAMPNADSYPHAEERRLFYVALTRARRHVTLIGVQGLESAFVAELLKEQRLELSSLSTVGASEPCPTCGRGILVVRRRRADGKGFLGCSTFPRCRFTRSSDHSEERLSV